ncbi:acylphosphatase [Candidatus Woesearchaeota archaeon]|nr:acylphosphatase [Candidatus Woesearchaeota archaeon]
MKRVYMIISGKVQGVFYRDFARKEAEKYGIVGFVRNLHDGTVEVLAEGDDDKLKRFILECKRGPLLAFIKDAKITEQQPNPGEYEDFSIRY